MKENFNFTLTELPHIELAGVSVLTDMVRAQNDCPLLWEKQFMPSATPLLETKSNGCSTYGLSFVEDAEKCSFNYWAALPWDKETPEKMKKISIPAGLYIKCVVNSLAEISLAYQATFQYVQESNDFDLNPEAPSVEEYPAAFPEPETIYLYMPIIKKAD